MVQRGWDADHKNQPHRPGDIRRGKPVCRASGGHHERIDGVCPAMRDDNAAAFIGRNGRRGAVEHTGTKGIPIINADVAAQRKEELLDSGGFVAGIEAEIDVFGEEDFGKGNHILLPVHLSFWRITSVNGLSGSMASGSTRWLFFRTKRSPRPS